MSYKHGEHVWVERDKITLLPIRIYATAKAFNDRPADVWVDYIPYDDAVGSIRHQIFVRSKGYCELCSVIITEKSHMHEQQHRGKGGEISLDNSVFICYSCHRNAHKDRRVRFGEK
jgi:hypothetical protein